jgi:hypothetical protein
MPKVNNNSYKMFECGASIEDGISQDLEQAIVEVGQRGVFARARQYVGEQFGGFFQGSKKSALDKELDFLESQLNQFEADKHAELEAQLAEVYEVQQKETQLYDAFDELDKDLSDDSDESSKTTAVPVTANPRLFKSFTRDTEEQVTRMALGVPKIHIPKGQERIYEPKNELDSGEKALCATLFELNAQEIDLNSQLDLKKHQAPQWTHEGTFKTKAQKEAYKDHLETYSKAIDQWYSEYLMIAKQRVEIGMQAIAVGEQYKAILTEKVSASSDLKTGTTISSGDVSAFDGILSRREFHVGNDAEQVNQRASLQA